jgi:hypothetical protein
MSKRETLAETTYNSVFFSIIHAPRAWVEEIVESMDDPAEFARSAISEHLTNGTRSTVVQDAIKAFAEEAANQARENVLNHPGSIV